MLNSSDLSIILDIGQYNNPFLKLYVKHFHGLMWYNANRIAIIYNKFEWCKNVLLKSKSYYLAQNSLSTMITKYLNFHGLSTKEHIQMYTRSLKSIQITDKHNHTIIHASQRWVHKNVGNYRKLVMDLCQKLLQYFSN